MRRCEAILDEMKAYADGELSLVKRGMVRMHVSRCTACREEAAAMKLISSNLAAGDAGELAMELRERLLAAAPAEGEWADRPISRSWRPRPLQVWSAVAIAAVAWFIFVPVFSQSKMSLESMPRSTGGAGGGASAYSQEYDESLKSQPETVTRQGISSGGMAGSAMAPVQAAPAQPEVSKNEGDIGRRDRAAAAYTGVRSDAGAAFDDKDGRVHAATKELNGPRGPVVDRIATLPPAGMPAPQRSPDHLRLYAPAQPSSSRAVKKTAEISISVKRLEESSDSVETMVKECGGYVANNQLSTDEEGFKSATLEVRVPVNLFEQMLAKFARLGSVRSKNVTGEDLTEQMSDEKQAQRVLGDELEDAKAKLAEARSRSDKRREGQNVKDLKVEIAQAEGRLELLKKEARLSTIKVELSEKPKPAPPVKTGGFIDDMSETGRSALASVSSAARIPVAAVIWLAVYAPVWIPLAIAYRYAAKAHRRKSDLKQWQARRAEGAQA